MPRQARLELPGIPMHVTQRGVNRCAIFLDDQDRHHYRRLLREACRKHGVAVHAFVLMDNHVHLLLSAGQAGRIALAMRAAGQAHVQAFNFRHGRSGTLWQGRFKSCLVDTDRYLLTVIRYIEFNPVRAAMVARPEDHRWSSVHTRRGQACDPLLTLHPLYLSLGHDSMQRAKAYGAWLRLGIGEDELADVRRHMAQERVLGDPRFQRMVERALNRPVTCRPVGRPRKRVGKGD
ncbi:MAG: transposase [Luteimonas sp.]|nr:transposase [Luteimonas sp.]